MKTIRNLTLYRLGIVSVLAVCLAGNIQAQIIAVKFVGGHGKYTLLPTDSTGVIGTTGWQNITGAAQSNISLVDANGNATSASFSLTGTSLATWGAGAPQPLTPTQELLGSWVEGEGSAMTLTLTNIPYASYDIYIYGARQSDDNSPPLNWTVTDGILTFSGTSLDSTNTIPTSFVGLSFGTGNPDFGDYALFSDETSSNLTITEPAGPNQWNGIAGFEIVDTSTVPEPSIYALLSGGILLLVVIGRRLKSVNF